MVSLKKVTKTYELGGEKIFALREVDLELKEGDFVAITGPSGSGKSTLANIIGGLDHPDSGVVEVGGVPVAEAKDAVLSRYRNETVGFVFQSFNLQPHYTATENVAVPLLFSRTVSPGQRNARAEECLKAVGLGDRLRHKPNQLSGGQRQRVAIARALVNSPKVIIADEPTGNLDSQKGDEIMDLLKKLNKETKVTLIIITHDPNVAKQSGRVLTIRDGQLT